MSLHFNLKGIFLFCAGLWLWWVFLPYPFLGALTLLGGYSLARFREISKADIIFFSALVLTVWYVLNAMGNVRQYDYYNFVMMADYYVRNGFFIDNPKMFLSEIYFQPPLWGLISALMTKTGMVSGLTQETAFDGVRFFSLFSIVGSWIIFWRLMTEFKFKKGVRLSLFSLFCFFPIGIIMANLVNNDALVYFLMMCAIQMSLLWYKRGAWRDAWALGGILFLAGMVKFSGLMIMVFTAALGLSLLIKNKEKLSLKLWGQFGVIGLCGVCGFSWGLFLLYFGFPLVPPPINVEFIDLSGVSLWQRFFGTDGLSYPFADVWGGYLEKNVILALIKTALFGEWAWSPIILGYGVYTLGAALGIALVWGFIQLFKYPFGEDFSVNFAMIVLVIAVLISWALFWREYPYFCSVEFRYVMILLPVSLLWSGNYLSQKTLPKWGDVTLAVLIGLFIIAEVMLFLNTI